MTEKEKVILETLPTLRAADFGRVRHGLARLETGGVNVGARVWPSTVVLLWCWNGRRRAQVVRKVRLPHPHYGYQVMLECPLCRAPRRVLRLANPAFGVFSCSDCLKRSGYKLARLGWRRSGRNRVPTKPGPWLRWLVKRAEEVVGSGCGGKN